jgi:hypothetical protein
MPTVKSKFQTIIKHLSGNDSINGGLANINVSIQFHPDNSDDISIARNLNAAFLITLSGESHSLFNDAAAYIDSFRNHPSWQEAAYFYNEARRRIYDEISAAYTEEEGLAQDLDDLYEWIITPGNVKNKQDTTEKIRALFFPEGVSLCDNRKERTGQLRQRRTVNISRLNRSPVTDPAEEILFTSNVLITIPLPGQNIDDLAVSDSLKEKLKKAVTEKQKYWYDHPIPVGIKPEHNEIIHGLEGLDDAVDFEKKRGTLDDNARVTCLLSVSVTHEGLKGIAREYIEGELQREKDIRHLDVYVFTEDDTEKVINQVLQPAAGKHLLPADLDSNMRMVFGVDGEYGRHYSFLKAIAAFWQVFINRGIKGTFKIDLDQVFPQEHLLKDSGHSAFQHLKTPLWGAEGTDNEGRDVKLGMIAGALVNQKDIGKSLFTPDVCFPPDRIRADQFIFFSSLPQALSTEAEMMTRYTNDSIDGKSRCLQRIHVTGGTCGILVDALRQYRPFTPTFIGRAEDQAYILSVLFDGDMNLRYLHKDGLIMRHDKEAFASDAIKMAATGKLIGDYVRILMFSYYVKSLPWPFDRIKNMIDPFTGCFASRTPLTVVYLRFALKAATFFADDNKDQQEKGLAFIEIGVGRLGKTIKYLTEGPNPLPSQYHREKKGWDAFYDILDEAEKDISSRESFSLNLQAKAKSLIEKCKINFKSNY